MSKVTYEVRYRKGFEGLKTTITLYDKRIECPLTPNMKFETFEAILINNMEKKKYRERSFGFRVVERHKRESNFMKQRSSLGNVARNFNFVAKHREQRAEILKEILSRFPANENNQAHWDTIQTAKLDTYLEIDHVNGQHESSDGDMGTTSEAGYESDDSDMDEHTQQSDMDSMQPPSDVDSAPPSDANPIDQQRPSLMARATKLLQKSKDQKLREKAKEKSLLVADQTALKQELDVTRNEVAELRKTVELMARVSLNLEAQKEMQQKEDGIYGGTREVSEDSQQPRQPDQFQDVSQQRLENNERDSLRFELENSYQAMKEAADKIKQMEGERAAERELIKSKEAELESAHQILLETHKLLESERDQMKKERKDMMGHVQKLMEEQKKKKSAHVQRRRVTKALKQSQSFRATIK